MKRDLFEALGKVVDAYADGLSQAQRAGKMPKGEYARSGQCVAALLRGVDRIADLPDDRDLTEAEIELFQSGLLQIFACSGVLLDELPLPGIRVAVVGFDLGDPQ